MKKRIIVSGLSWGGSSALVIAVCQLMFLAVLSRLLSPRDFGTVAMASVCLRFLSYFSQLGITPALIQKSELSADDVAAALTTSLAISSVCCALAFALAPIAAWALSVDELTSVLQALSLVFILQGVAAVSTGLMRRNHQYKQLNLIEASSYIFGYGCVGVLFAFQDFGVWSLVLATLSQAATSTSLSYLTTRHALSLSHTKAARNHFIGFGGKYSVIGFIEFLSNNVDTLVIGKILGPIYVGIYSRALLIANLPVQQPSLSLSKVCFH